MYTGYDLINAATESVDEVNKSASEDEDIVAGHQKMSLKCPVSDHLHPVSASRLTSPLAELHADPNALSLEFLRAPAVLRCYVVVLGDGADHDMVVSCMRESPERRGSHYRRVSVGVNSLRRLITDICRSGTSTIS